MLVKACERDHKLMAALLVTTTIPPLWVSQGYL